MTKLKFGWCNGATTQGPGSTYLHVSLFVVRFKMTMITET